MLSSFRELHVSFGQFGQHPFAVSAFRQAHPNVPGSLRTYGGNARMLAQRVHDIVKSFGYGASAKGEILGKM